MTTTLKRFALAIALISVAVTACPALGADEKSQAPRQYRVIFNCDGHAVCKDANGDREQWIENLFGPLEESHVDAPYFLPGDAAKHAHLLTGLKRRVRTPRNERRQQRGRPPHTSPSAKHVSPTSPLQNITATSEPSP